MKGFPTMTIPRLFCGNCVDVGRQLYQAGERFDLVFGDPPFNIGHGYVEHDDAMSSTDFEQFMRDWLDVGANLLTPAGLLAVHVPDDLAVITIRHMIALELRHWILWHFRFGQAGAVATATKCITSKVHLLVWCHPGAKTVFNPPLVPSDRCTKYSDRRTQQTATPGMRVAFDFWGLPEDGPYWGRVQGNNAERWDRAHGALIDHPNQLPEVYVQRVVETFTDPAVRMLVMFGGSGTELVVGQALGRIMTGIEIGQTTCESIILRLKRGPVRLPPAHQPNKTTPVCLVATRV